MPLALTDEQIAIRDTARDYLRDHAGFERLRQTIGGEAGWDDALWRGFAGELGFAGVGIAGVDGGIGLGAIEQALVLEELGRTLAPIPWFESVILAGGVIAMLATGAMRDRLLRGIASGDEIATLALRDEPGRTLPEGIGPTVATRNGEMRVSGTAHHVPFGHVASLIVVAARAPGACGWDGLTLAALPADMPGLTVQRVTGLDLTRPLAVVHCENVVAPPASLLGPVGGAGPALRRSLHVAAGLLAAEMLGGAARSLDETVAYARQRVQFGRTIGSFQAVKHRLADMKLLVDYSRNAADRAARAIAADTDVERSCAAAASYCGDAFLTCAADAIQLHGGIGFTWEHHAHLFFKRARAAAAMLGCPADHREVIARSIIDAAEAA